MVHVAARNEISYPCEYDLCEYDNEIRKVARTMTMTMSTTMRAVVCVIAIVMLVALPRVSFAQDISSEYETSTVTGLRKFDKISNVSSKASKTGCSSVRIHIHTHVCIHIDAKA